MGTVGSPIHDAGAHPPPTRKWTDDAGNIVIEKLPAGPSTLMLDMAGHVRRFVMTNGAKAPMTNYWPQKKAALERAGALSYLECPMHNGALVHFVPKDMRSNPCMPDTFGKSKGPCPHIIELEKRRKAKNLALAEIEQARHKTWEEKRYEAEQAKVEKLEAEPAVSATDIAVAVANALADRDAKAAGTMGALTADETAEIAATEVAESVEPKRNHRKKKGGE